MSRLLRALVIHDSELPNFAAGVFGTNWLDFCKVRFLGSGVELYQVRTWRDIVLILQAIAHPKQTQVMEIDPLDLVFIDCHFSEDYSSPDVGARQADLIHLEKFSESVALDPRGLLYGGILTSSLLSAKPGRPLGFAVYSQDLARVSQDGYAQTFYSLLLALADKVPVGLSPSLLQKAMEEAPQVSTPQPVVSIALSMFRASLESAFQASLNPDPTTLHSCLRELEAAVEFGERPVEGSLSLRWTSSEGEEDSIYLASIFADCIVGDTAWSGQLLRRRDALGFLRRIEEGVAYVRRILRSVENEVDKFVEGLVAGKLPVPLDLSVFSEAPEGDREKTLVFFLISVVALCRVNSRQPARRERFRPKAKPLTAFMAMDAAVINRFLGRVLGNAEIGRKSTLPPTYPAAKLLVTLNEAGGWPFKGAGWIRLLIVRYLRERRERFPILAEQFWPRCIGEKLPVL